MKTVYIDNDNIGKWKAKRIAKRINIRNKKDEVVVALSKNLIDNKIMLDALNKYNLKVLNGRWLFKFLIKDILDYLSKIKDESLDALSLAILMDNADEIIIQQMIQIAKKVKSFKIITASKTDYLYIENELFDKYGIAIQITNNKEKSISSVDIILNFDFNKERFETFKINHNAIIINLKDRIELNKDIFSGNVINDYEISFNEESFKNKLAKEIFENNILYESYIYRRDTYENVRKQIENDAVKIIKLK